MADKKDEKYRVLCWGDCKKFPELGERCFLTSSDKLPYKHLYEGDVVGPEAFYPQDIPILIGEGLIEAVKE